MKRNSWGLVVGKFYVGQCTPTGTPTIRYLRAINEDDDGELSASYVIIRAGRAQRKRCSLARFGYWRKRLATKVEVSAQDWPPRSLLNA